LTRKYFYLRVCTKKKQFSILFYKLQDVGNYVLNIFDLRLTNILTTYYATDKLILPFYVLGG